MLATSMIQADRFEVLASCEETASRGILCCHQRYTIRVATMPAKKIQGCFAATEMKPKRVMATAESAVAPPEVAMATAQNSPHDRQVAGHADVASHLWRKGILSALHEGQRYMGCEA